MTPKVNHRIRKLEQKARYANVRQTWEYEFEVELNGTNVGVKLDEKSCDCGYWQLKGIPCVHALACLNTIRDPKKQIYTHPYFHTDAWKSCYSGVIHPIPSKDLWPQFSKRDMLHPPEVKRPPGRPTTKRRKDPVEKELAPRRVTKLKATCGKCGGIGHNSRGCKNEAIPKKPKGKPGRPRKKPLTKAGTNEVLCNLIYLLLN